MDEAEEVLEMAEDPFMEAGIAIPKDLPAYVNRSAKAMNSLAPAGAASASDADRLETISIVSGGSGMVRGALSSLRFRNKRKGEEEKEEGGTAKPNDLGQVRS